MWEQTPRVVMKSTASTSENRLSSMEVCGCCSRTEGCTLSFGCRGFRWGDLDRILALHIDEGRENGLFWEG